jgi:hypothetical protein
MTRDKYRKEGNRKKRRKVNTKNITTSKNNTLEKRDSNKLLINQLHLS